MIAGELQGFFGGDGNVLKLTVVMIACVCENTKTTELYTLNVCVVWHVNYI